MTITFYSYKGGVGRTQLCANIAAYLCHFHQKKVLLWDWDLEAPGLHHYFNKSDSEVEKKGTIDIVYTYIDTVRRHQAVSKDDLELISKDDHVCNVATNSSGGKIDLIPAGYYDANYGGRLAELDWQELFMVYDGAVFFELLKQQILSFNYDYVLIDSRTGISDYAGICSVLLPDANVIVIGPNKQNFFGCKKVVDQILGHEFVKDGFRPDFILPILSRLDSDHDDSDQWTDDFLKTFSGLIHNLFALSKDKSADQHNIENLYLTNSYLRYTYSISAGENLFFTEDLRVIGPVSYKRNFANIAEMLIDLNDLGRIQVEGQEELTKGLSSRTWEEILRKAQEAKDEGDVKSANDYYKEAIYLFKRLLVHDSEYSEGWLNLGIAHLGRKEHLQAKEAFQKSLEVDKSSTQALINLGICYFELGEFRKARFTMQEAVETAPNDLHKKEAAEYYYGWMLLEAGKKPDGLELLNKFQLEWQLFNQVQRGDLLKKIDDTE